MTSTVLYFTDSAGFGGAEQVLLHTLAGLDRGKWHPILVHHPEPGLMPLLNGAQSVKVDTWAVPRMPEGSKGAMRVPAFVQKLRSKRPAVFHAHLTWPLACKYALLAAVLARIPAVVATEHVFVDVRLSRSTYLQQRVIAAGVDRYITVSEEIARRLCQTFHIPHHKIQVIRNGIPLAPFKRQASTTLRAGLKGTTNRPIVLTTARLNKQKGLCYLLQAAALVPEALFVLVGDGPERAQLEAQARELELDNRVSFLGYRQDIPDLLASCDLFVLPSLFEGLPLSVLEAMAVGKPVIATAIGGTDEAVIHGETGLLVPPADSSALAGAIRKLLSEPMLAHKLAMAGKARVQQHFSAETMIQRTAQLYEQLLCQQTITAIA